MEQTVFLPVGAAYDRWSPFYDTYDNPMVSMASEIIGRAAAPLAAGRDVFEFGCGTGRNLAALRDAGARSAAGCDLSGGMLEAARGRGLEVFEHDMREPLPVREATADLVLFSLTLEHVSDLRVPLGQTMRLLRKTGRVWIIEIHPFLSFQGVAAHFDDAGTEVRMPAFPHRFEDYLNACASLGLVVEYCREWRPRDASNPEPFKAFSRGPDFPITLELRVSR